MISGLLNIDKPKGITSHDVVARVRKLSGQRKVGHTGTLDPMATGVLLVCLGQATRLIEYLQSGRKQYRATVRFGVATDTLDAEGEIIAQREIASLTETQLRQILPLFEGEIEQTPPLFSALKKDGRPLYKLARAGQSVEVPARTVTIYSLEWLAWQPPDLTIDVVCSPGTYIRSLARDLGEAVHTGAHLVDLIRTANSGWSLSEAVPLADLEQEAAAGSTAWQNHLQPLDRAVSHLPQVTLNQEEHDHVRHGRPIRMATTEPPSEGVSLLRAYTPDGSFLAILTRKASDDTLWQPKKVFHPSDRQ